MIFEKNLTFIFRLEADIISTSKFFVKKFESFALIKLEQGVYNVFFDVKIGKKELVFLIQ